MPLLLRHHNLTLSGYSLSSLFASSNNLWMPLASVSALLSISSVLKIEYNENTKKMIIRQLAANISTLKSACSLLYSKCKRASRRSWCLSSKLEAGRYSQNSYSSHSCCLRPAQTSKHPSFAEQKYHLVLAYSNKQDKQMLHRIQVLQQWHKLQIYAYR